MKTKQSNKAFSGIDALIAAALARYQDKNVEFGLEGFIEGIAILKQALEKVKAMEKHPTKSITPEEIQKYLAKIYYQLAVGCFENFHQEESIEHCINALKAADQIHTEDMTSFKINTYLLLGRSYVEEDKPEAARKAQENLLKLVKPDSVEMSDAIDLLADIALKEGEMSRYLFTRKETIENLEKALALKIKIHGEESVEVGLYYRKMGTAYTKMKPEKAIGYYNKSIAILEKVAPNSVDLAFCYYEAGKYELKSKNYANVFPFLERSYELFELSKNPANPKHRWREYEAHRRESLEYMARAKAELGQYDDALVYVERLKAIDVENIYHYRTKTYVLEKRFLKEEPSLDLNQKEQKLKEIITLCDQARKHGILEFEVGALGVKMAAKLAAVEKELYGKVKSRADIARYADLAQTWLVDLVLKQSPVQFPDLGPAPKAQDEPTSELAKAVEDIKDLGIKVASQEAKIAEIKAEIKTLDSRVASLETKVYDLTSTMALVQSAVTDVDKRIKDANGDAELVANLKLEKAKLEVRRKTIKSFNDDHDLADFFFSLLTELEAAYIAARAVQSGKIDITSTSTDPSKAAFIKKVMNYAAILAKLAPVVGGAVSAGLGAVEVVAESYDIAARTIQLKRIAEISETITDFDQIALRLAVKITEENKEKILALNRAKVDRNLKNRFKALKGGLSNMIISIIDTDQTKATLEGKMVAMRILLHLQQERVSQGLRFEEEKDQDQITYKTRYSVIADKIVEAMIASMAEQEAMKSRPSNAVRQPRANGEKSCCVVM